MATNKKILPKNKQTSKKPVSKVRSFKVSPDNPTFTTFKVTRQTAYWTILVAFIIFMQLWILAKQLETSEFIEREFATQQENS